MDTKPFWKDGTRTTNTASLCQKLGGLRSRELALEDHSYVATREERTRNEKSWVLKLNNEGASGPMTQRPDLVEAKRETKRPHDEHVEDTSEGSTPTRLVQRSRQRKKQFEGLEDYNYQVDPRTGWRTYPSKSQGNLSRNPTHSSSSTQWEQHDDWEVEQKLEFLAILLKLNSSDFLLLRLPEIEFPGNRRGGVDRYTCRTPHFHMYSHCTDHTAQMTCVHWLKTSCAPENIPSSTRHD